MDDQKSDRGYVDVFYAVNDGEIKMFNRWVDKIVSWGIKHPVAWFVLFPVILVILWIALIYYGWMNR